MNARFRHRLTLIVLAGLVLAAGLAALVRR